MEEDQARQVRLLIVDEIRTQIESVKNIVSEHTAMLGSIDERLKSLFGNSSGRKGYLERAEDRQDAFNASLLKEVQSIREAGILQQGVDIGAADVLREAKEKQDAKINLKLQVFQVLAGSGFLALVAHLIEHKVTGR